MENKIATTCVPNPAMSNNPPINSIKPTTQTKIIGAGKPISSNTKEKESRFLKVLTYPEIAKITPSAKRSINGAIKPKARSVGNVFNMVV